MGALVDLTGETFGRLTVIERAYTPGLDPKARWRCKCECGQEVITRGELLRRGATWKCRTACLAAEGRRPWPRDPRYFVGEDGTMVGPRGELLRPHLPAGGVYPQLVIRRHGAGKAECHHLHVIVCETFHGPRPAAGMQVAHENGVPTDCRASNLRWSTVVDNAADKVRHGTAQYGELIGTAKLTDEIVRSIRQAHAAGESQYSLARRYGVTRPNIGYIVRRETWRHVS